MKSVRRALPLLLVAALTAPAAARSAVDDPDTEAPSPQASAVAIMRDSGQALLWDAARGEYLLVKAGDRFQGFFVVTISEEAVVVANEATPGSRHVLRLAPAPTSRSGRARASRPTVITLAPTELGGADLDVLDPYPSDGLEVVDPYSGPPGKTAAAPTAVAPTVVYAEDLDFASPAQQPPVRAVRAPVTVDPTGAPGAPSYAPGARAERGPSKPALVPAGPKQTERTVKIERAELDAALADFDALSKEIQIERAPGGGVKIVGLSRGSFFDRVGLREDDVVHSVAGVRLTNIESAALVYTRVKASDRFDVEVERGRGRLLLTLVLE